MTDQSKSIDPVLLNDFRRQWAELGDDVLAATRRAGESGWYILGKEVQGFESDLATYLGRVHVIGCANGLDAIEIALRSMGIRQGDRVLTTPLSAFATTLAVARAGGVPVFIDVDEFGLIDLDLARATLERDRDIRFFLPVHLYGHALNLTKLAALKRDFEVQVVEDCCQAIGAKWGDLPVGSVGAMSALSFYPTKNLGAIGDGGAILTDDAAHGARSRALRDYGQSSRYRHDILGLNSRLDELHAAMLRTAMLPRLPAWTERRRAIARKYLQSLGNSRVTVPGAPEGSNSVWHLFPVLVPARDRDDFRAHLDRGGVSSAIHYPELISKQEALKSIPFEVLGPMPRTEQYCVSEVSLPIHPYMTDAEVDRVIATVNAWPSP